MPWFVHRHRLYVLLKAAKSRVPGLRRVRMLKKSPYTDRYGHRRILSPDEGNALLLDRIADGALVAAGKIGDCELEALVKYEAADGDAGRFFQAINDQGHEMELLYTNTGVFPKGADTVTRWAETYLKALGALDVLAVWHNVGEEEIANRYAPQATLTRIRGLDPFYHRKPWTSSLKEKRVLAVTPFEQTVVEQRRRYRGRDLFPRVPDLLPDFDLTVVRSPFSAALVPATAPDWHAALADIKEQITNQEFDVCLVGAGAYSIPVCAFVRTELHRSAVHLGGTLQLFFGIRGKRWDSHPFLKTLYNENWTRPVPSEQPRGRWRIEGGAYW
jgi:hypothetical protein